MSHRQLKGTEENMFTEHRYEFIFAFLYRIISLVWIEPVIDFHLYCFVSEIIDSLTSLG